MAPCRRQASSYFGASVVAISQSRGVIWATALTDAVGVSARRARTRNLPSDGGAVLGLLIGATRIFQHDDAFAREKIIFAYLPNGGRRPRPKIICVGTGATLAVGDMQVVCAAGPREAAARPMLKPRGSPPPRCFFGASGARGFGAVGVGDLESALFQAE